MKMCHCWLSDH